MKRSTELYRLDVLEAIATIYRYVDLKKGIYQLDDTLLQNSVLFQLMVVGEAVAHLPEQWFNESEVPRDKVIGLRNMIVHGYFKVDLKVVWDVVREHLPVLHEHLSNK
jgi:uncharacterized protein with HEPN domain